MTHKGQYIAVTFDDGGVGIMQFVLDPRTNEGRIVREATRDAVQAEIDKSAWGTRKVVGWRYMDASEIPASREYRDAWKDDGKAIVHDLPKARDIHRDKLRAGRVPMLAALDVEYQRADESGQQIKKQDIAARKQRLRDIPADPRIEAASTVADLQLITL